MSLTSIWNVKKIPLPQAVAGHLGAGEREALDHVLVVLPTIETGRRVVEVLLQEDKVLFPPRFATPLTLIPFGKGEGVATSTQAALAWHATLAGAGGCPLTFGEHSGSKFAGHFVTLTRDLAAAGKNIPAAAKILAAKDPRWDEWCGLWGDYIARLQSVGLCCPAEAQMAAAENFQPPAGVTKILVAGVADLPPLAHRALRDCDVELLIHAPGRDREAFGEFGHASPEFWSSARLPISESQIRVASGPVELGRVAAAIPASKRMVLFSGDAGLSKDLACALRETGREGFLPEGSPLSRHPVIRLALLIARLPGDGSWKHLETLVFHPDFSRWASLPDNVSAEWNRLGRLTFCAGLEGISGRLGQPRSSEEEKDRLRLGKTFAPFLKKLSELKKKMIRGPVAPALREILSDIYGSQNLAARPGDKEAMKALLGLLEEISAFPSLAQPDASVLLALLENLPGAWTPSHEPDAVEIKGWLELAGEDAPVIVLAGLNEGLLPGKRRVDPLLPDAARAALGLDDAISRQARDASILSAALAVRDPGDVHVLSLQQAADGSPLKPSRLLLRVPDEHLPQRVRTLVTPPPARVEAPPRRFCEEPFQVPRPTGPLTSLSVTAFKAHLACPLRCYLSRRLGFKEPSTGTTHLEPDVFGSWIHDVLKQLGGEPNLSTSQDEDEIWDWLAPRWNAFFKGLDDNVIFRLQRESGLLRLRHFVRVHVGLRKEGWKTKYVEWDFPEVTPPGWPLALRGRIDRVDEREGELLLIDYKTGSLKKNNPARSMHLEKDKPSGCFGVKPVYAKLGEEVWCDLQLPLYALAISRTHPDTPKIRPAYFLIGDEVENIGLFEWEDFDRESAERCALGIAKEAADDAVLQWIQEKDFSRFAMDPKYDDFESLALSRYIEEKAIEVL